MASRWWLLVPRPLRRLPPDLAATGVLTLFTVVVAVTPVVDRTPLRVVVGLPFVLFSPGYALVAALFPERARSTDDGDHEGIDGIERVTLSVGLSIAVTPLLGLVLNFTPWGIRLGPILVAVGGFTLVATGVAALRRWDVPEAQRFSPPYRAWLDAGRIELLEPDSRTDAVLNVVLVASVLLAVGSVGYAVAVPKQGGTFTEFYLLTHRDNGSLVAANYPTEFTQGQARPVVVGIGNHEHHAETYTVVVELQRVSIRNDTTTVRAQHELQRFGAHLAANATWTSTRSIRPTMTGTRLRLAFLLYKRRPPSHPSVGNAYREAHLWVNVTARNQSSLAAPVAVVHAPTAPRRPSAPAPAPVPTAG